jgi:predicted small metal-binding protein
MSQIFEDFSRSLCVRCSDVGLNCGCVIFGKNEEKVMDMTIMHMFEYHAINPEEMTSEMKSKIKENIHASRDKVRAQHLLPRVF